MDSEILKEINELEAERNKIFKTIEPMQKRLVDAWERIRTLKEIYSQQWIKEMGDTPDWPLIVRVMDGLDNSPLSSVALLHYVDKHLEQFNLRKHGYWTDTLDPSFSIMLYRNIPTDIEKVMQGLRLFTPLLKPHKDGYVWFHIFDHNLSAYESYHFHVKPDFSSFQITGRSQRVIEEFTDLEYAVNYVRINYWYAKDRE